MSSLAGKPIFNLVPAISGLHVIYSNFHVDAMGHTLFCLFTSYALSESAEKKLRKLKRQKRYQLQGGKTCF